MTGNANKNHDFLKKLTEFTEANLQNEQFGVKELAREMNMSRSSLHRKIVEAAGIPANQFICRVRLKKALKILTETSLTVSETAYECGFHSVTYFSKCFRDYYSYSPGKAAARSKTELSAETSGQQKNGKWKNWLLPPAALIIFGLTAFIISETAWFGPLNSVSPEKINTIAILPPKFEGSDSMQMMAAGLTEALLNHLMEIEKLDVRSRTSVEQYRETTKPLKEIAEEIKVDYLIEISGWQYEDNMQLQINLADADKDNYLLREPYTANIKEESFLDLQNDIVSDIIEKTKTTFSSTEKEVLNERLTNNPAALNAYLQGLSYLDLSTQKGFHSLRQEALEEMFKAKRNFEKAIQLDPGFIAAYVRLAHIYISKINSFNKSQRNGCLDSGLIMAEKAISLNNDRAKGPDYLFALSLKSTYMEYKGNLSESRRLFEEAIKYDAHHSYGHYEGNFSKYSGFEDYYMAISSFYNYVELKPEDDLIAPWIYHKLCKIFIHTGFQHVAEKYVSEWLNASLDSSIFYQSMSFLYLSGGNFESCIEYANKGIKINHNPYEMYLLSLSAFSYVYLREYTSAFEIIKKIEKKNNPAVPDNYYKSLAAFVYLKNGQPTYANQKFQEIITGLNNEINSGHLNAALYYSHFELAMVYAALDEKEKALHYLKEVTNKTVIPAWMLINLQYFPALDNLKNDREFIKLKKELTDKYQKEHKRLEKLLRRNGESV